MKEIKLPKEDLVFRKKKDLLKWGEKEFNIVKPHLNNFNSCLDIGAHVGLTTLRYASNFKYVHSFEPIHYSFLVENTSHLNNVIQYKEAVSDIKTIVEMYPGTENSGVGIIPYADNMAFIKNRFLRPNTKYSNVKPIMVNTITIDGLNISDVDFIKIDVEGYNMPILKGMMETMKRCKPIIQLEMAFEQKVNDETSALLISLGYAMFDTYDRDNFYKII